MGSMHWVYFALLAIWVLAGMVLLVIDSSIATYHRRRLHQYSEATLKGMHAELRFVGMTLAVVGVLVFWGQRMLLVIPATAFWLFFKTVHPWALNDQYSRIDTMPLETAAE